MTVTHPVLAEHLQATGTRRAGVLIQMAAGTGTAPTPLAAFDAALLAVGAGNLNLVRLSSVIPVGSDLAHRERVEACADWGDRLFCVYAEACAEVPGRGAAAGVGWVVKDDGSGGGLMVEHHADTEAEVARQVRASLAAMTETRGGGFGPPQMRLVSATCTDQPVCALVLAAFDTAGWGR